TLSAFSIWARTSTNGARIGFAKTTTPILRSATRQDQSPATGEHPAAALGAITSRPPVARRDPASHRHFNMPTMDSESCARAWNSAMVQQRVIAYRASSPTMDKSNFLDNARLDLRPSDWIATGNGPSRCSAALSLVL